MLCCQCMDVFLKLKASFPGIENPYQPQSAEMVNNLFILLCREMM